jgi:hypothetical protein
MPDQQPEIGGSRDDPTGAGPKTVRCQICHQQKKPGQVLPADLIRESVVETMRKQHPDWSSSGFICLADLNHFRSAYVEDVLQQEAKDRLRAEHDYRVNLKAELEIRHLNGKVDLLLTHQWQRLLEIQRIQMELLEELVPKRPG